MNIDRTSLLALLLMMSFTAFAGCSDDTTDTPETIVADDAPVSFVPEGKADDYRSTKGKEYLLLGIDVVRLDVADADLTGEARDAKVKELVEARFKALSFFTYAYLAGKSSSDSNADYGGFRTTIRQQTFESYAVGEVPDEPGAYEFLFEAEAGGPDELLTRLPIKDDGSFDLIVPKLTNEELLSGSYTSRYKHFNAADWDASVLDIVEVSIEEQKNEPDAYPEYNAMFEDGVLDVAIVIGGDYNDSRWDLTTARDLFTSLQNDTGLKAPVDTYEELQSDSGPFLGTIDANGEEVEIQVYLYHPDMHKEEGVGYEGLIQLYKDSAATRDVVLYDGHAGYNSTYSGIVVHYNPRHAVAADDFSKLELPSKYQLFIMNGCKTYTSYADAMYAHPNKDASNLDIITTVNFSWLSQMTKITSDFLGHLTETRNDTHAPKSYDQILADMNKGRSWDVIYGVHGLSDNPRLSPYAKVDSLCDACAANSDCAGIDNLCVFGSNAASSCAAACTDDSGCPDGYSCRPAAVSGSSVITTTQCLPTSGACR